MVPNDFNNSAKTALDKTQISNQSFNHPSTPYIHDAGLFTDFYELTMVQGYFTQGIHETTTTFDYFFREQPFGNGFVVFAGLQDLLDTLSELRFSPEAFEFLASKGFRRSFWDYLAGFRFRDRWPRCLKEMSCFLVNPSSD
jgi:Nicotinic acid phosphoribosyltransferase